MIKTNSAPYNYLPYEFKDNKKIFSDWKKLIKSTDFTIGKYVDEFEKTSFERSETSLCNLSNC